MLLLPLVLLPSVVVMVLLLGVLLLMLMAMPTLLLPLLLLLVRRAQACQAWLVRSSCHHPGAQLPAPMDAGALLLRLVVVLLVRLRCMLGGMPMLPQRSGAARSPADVVHAKRL